MRVKVLLKNSTAHDLVATLREEDGTEVESIGVEKDLTEQAFGIAELGAIVAVVRGALELAQAIRKFAQRSEAARTSVTIETPLGKAKFELSQEMSVEEIRSIVDPLFATK